MKPFHAARDISDKNYWALEEFLDLLIQTLDIVEDAGMLPIVLHQNNLRLMYEKWQHSEQTRCWTSAERFSIQHPGPAS
jgi:hypothetical protein